MIQYLLVRSEGKFLRNQFERRGARSFGTERHRDDVHNREQHFRRDKQSKKLQKKLSPEGQVTSANFSGSIHIQDADKNILVLCSCWCSHVSHLRITFCCTRNPVGEQEYDQ